MPASSKQPTPSVRLNTAEGRSSRVAVSRAPLSSRHSSRSLLFRSGSSRRSSVSSTGELIPEERPLNIFNADGEIEFFTSEPRTIDPFEDLRSLYKGHADAVAALEIDHSAMRLYSASWDDRVIIWNTHTRSRIGELPHASWVNDVKVVQLVPAPREQMESALGTSPQSQMHDPPASQSSAVHDRLRNLRDMMQPRAKFVVTACEDGNLTVWDPSELTVVFQVTLGFGALTRLAVADDLVFAASLWTTYAVSLVAGVVVREYCGRSDVNCLVAHGEHLYCGLQDSKVLCWDVAGAFVLRELACAGTPAAVRDLIVSPKHNAIYTGADDGRIRVWTLSTGACLRTVIVSSKPVRSLALHVGKDAAESFIYAAALDGQIKCVRLSNFQARTVRNLLCNCLAIYDDKADPQLIGGDHSGVIESFTLKATEEAALKLQV